MVGIETDDPSASRQNCKPISHCAVHTSGRFHVINRILYAFHPKLLDMPKSFSSISYQITNEYLGLSSPFPVLSRLGILTFSDLGDLPWDPELTLPPYRKCTVMFPTSLTTAKKIRSPPWFICIQAVQHLCGPYRPFWMQTLSLFPPKAGFAPHSGPRLLSPWWHILYLGFDQYMVDLIAGGTRMA